MHNAKTKLRHPDAFSLVDQLDLSDKSFKSAYGRRYTDTLQDRHPFLHCEVASDCTVVTILDSDDVGNPIPIQRGAPDASKIVTHASMGSVTQLLKRKVLYSLNEPAKVTSTPILTTRKGTKRPASTTAVTPMTPKPPDGTGKRLRQDGDEKDSQPTVDINVHINILVEEHKVDLDFLASHVVERLLVEAREKKFEPSKNLQTLAHHILQRCTNKDGIVTLQHVDSMERMYTAQYVPLTKPRKETAELEDNNRVIAKKAKALFQALSQQKDQQNAILTELANEAGFELISQEKLKFSVTEVIALRDFVRTSQNGVMR